MKSFPVIEEEYIIDESIEQFIKRLFSVTDRYQQERFLNKRKVDYSKLYYGKVNKTDFQITRYITHGNSMNPEIVGVINNVGDKNILSLTYQIKKDVKRMSISFGLVSLSALVIFLSIDISNLVHGRFSVIFLIPLLMLIGSILIVKFGFKLDIDDSKQAMRDFINKRST